MRHRSNASAGAVLQAARSVDTLSPVCSDLSCAPCRVERRPGESRAAFVARLRTLYATGALAGIGALPPLPPPVVSEPEPTLVPVLMLPVPTRIPLPTATPCQCGQPRTFGRYCDDCREIDHRRQRLVRSGAPT